SGDFKAVPLVIDTKGKTLLTAEDALNDAEKAKEKSKKTQKARRKFDSNFNVIQEVPDGDNALTTPPWPNKSKKRARVEDEPRGSRKGKKAKLYKLSEAQLEALAALTADRFGSEDEDEDDDDDEDD
ncbi:hypothetical protein H0H92_000993, partial [Tricholoma furcatifolium]